MRDGWLDVPLAEYEAHMVCNAQLSALSLLFARALDLVRPASVAVLGIAGGNGLEHIDHRTTHRICGIDVNPTYLQTVVSRFATMEGLELLCADLSAMRIQLPPFELVHAALIFEHAGLALAVQNAVELVAANGRLSVVLQLPSPIAAAVSQNAVPSIQGLASGFKLINPCAFEGLVAEKGLHLEQVSQYPLPEGKAFWHGIFQRDSGSK